ncbi:MAG TPA: cytochrome P460 family protein [Gemmatimonadota bacterium]|nr:cytochrome P460 family protein [Gemmatimonadota bacterium]
MSLRGPTVLVIAAILVTRCQVPPQEAGAPAGDSVATRLVVEAQVPAVPDTTGEAVLAWLEAEQYRETWDPWRGTTLLSGAEPHGAVLTTYANPVAIEALSRGALAMPPGAIIVLEGYLPDSSLSSVSVMVQAGAFDPEGQDWFFARFGSAGEIEAAGRLEACRGCHVLEPDYLFSGELGTPLPVDSTGAFPEVADSL